MDDSHRIRIPVLAGALAALALQGCVATRNWVREQLDVVNGRIDGTERRLGEVDGKADRALAGLQNLQLERKLVLDMKEGAVFSTASATLTRHAKTEIDRFLKELDESAGGAAGAAAARVFVVAGHTDSTGPEDFNYELGQRRASRVAAYLVGEKGMEPLGVHVVSYGATKPLADNKTRNGRLRNRRIEILVYQERVASR
ncbi:MAG: OmpA family protein [Deltaproteobacteria bacterium]|nr:OmpA family protein [Deltaproteobacteria bacterium]